MNLKKGELLAVIGSVGSGKVRIDRRIHFTPYSTNGDANNYLTEHLSDVPNERN